MSSQIRLHVSQGADTSRSFDIKENQTLIVGRGRRSDTKLTDPALSRLHFSLEYLDGRILLADLGSATGTFLNGSRIEGRTEADCGDEVIAGGTKMFLSLVGRIDSDTMLPSKNSVLGELHGLVGSWIGGYLLRKVIGVGKTGLVFEAHDESNNRPVAVKVFSQKFTGDKAHRERFVQGARAYCKIQNPNLIRLYKAGKNSSSYYYAAMELVLGESLDSLIARIGIEGMLDWKEVWRCAYHIASALVTTYEHNVIHRNLVPRNIIRRFKDRTYLLGDFALATPIELVSYGQDFVSELSYLPPERIRDAIDQIRDANNGMSLDSITDIRSDIFGLGSTCYGLLTGKPPAGGIGMSDVIASIRGQVPPLPTQVHMSVNDQFQSAVMKMISKNPDDRHQTPQQLVKDLGQIGRLNGLL